VKLLQGVMNEETLLPLAAVLQGLVLDRDLSSMP
jgi:hypothetical protein